METPAAPLGRSSEPRASGSLGSRSVLPGRLLSAERRLAGLLVWAHWPKQGFKNREASHRNSDCCLLLNSRKLELSGPQSSGGRAGQGAGGRGPPYRPWAQVPGGPHTQPLLGRGLSKPQVCAGPRLRCDGVVLSQLCTEALLVST